MGVRTALGLRLDHPNGRQKKIHEPNYLKQEKIKCQ